MKLGQRRSKEERDIDPTPGALILADLCTHFTPSAEGAKTVMFVAVDVGTGIMFEKALSRKVGVKACVLEFKTQLEEFRKFLDLPPVATWVVD